MRPATVRLFIDRRFIPQDGEALTADDRLAADLAVALAAVPVVNAGLRIRVDRQRGGDDD